MNLTILKTEYANPYLLAVSGKQTSYELNVYFSKYHREGNNIHLILCDGQYHSFLSSSSALGKQFLVQAKRLGITEVKA